MDKVIFKLKGLVIENVSPFMMTIIKIWKLREEMGRARAEKGIRKISLELDREIMKDVIDG